MYYERRTYGIVSSIYGNFLKMSRQITYRADKVEKLLQKIKKD
jgi:hypothetical protein